MKNRTIKLFEAFAGIGSQHFALKKIKSINVKVVGICEWDIKALLAYKIAHYPNIKEELIDRSQALDELSNYDFSWNGYKAYPLERLNDKLLNKLYNANKIVNNFGSVQNLSKLTKKKLPESSDIFVYSFPCQDLATGGKGLGMKKGSGTRSGLLWELESYFIKSSLQNKSPKILLLENVSVINSPKHRVELDKWLGFLTSIGYENHLNMTLNALDYGLPQNRKRTFIISAQKDLTINLELIRQGILNDKKPRKTLKIHNFVSLNHCEVEEDEAWLNRTPSRERMWQTNKKDLTNNPALGTITCNMDRSNNAGMFRYKNSYRLLTIREAFRLMGFDEKVYERISKLGFSYRQLNKLIGNSIAINVLEVIFKNILNNVSF